MTLARPMRTIVSFLILLASLQSLPAAALTPINLQLRWHHQFQFAGYYAAVDQGYFKEKGLEVLIHAGGPGQEPAQEVASGRAQFGVANSEILYQHLRKEHSFLALAAIFQHSPSALLVKRYTNIESPKDLRGRRIMLVAKQDDIELLAMIHNEGVNLDEVIVQKSSYNLQDLIDDKTDAFNAYSTNEPFFLQQRDIPYNLILPRQYGVDFYNDLLFTTAEYEAENSQIVHDFREAALKGWRYALNHPEEMIELIQTRYSSRKSAQHLRFEYEQMRPLILSEMIQLGHINANRIDHMARTLESLGMVLPDYELGNFIYRPESHLELKKWRNRALLLGSVLSGIFIVALSLLYFNRKLTANITRRRVAEAEMEEQKALFEAFFNSLPDAALITDADGLVRISNPAFSRVFGYLPEEIKGQPITMLQKAQPQDSAPPFKMQATQAELYKRKDNSIFPGEPHSGPILIENQQTMGYIHLVRDVTELKHHQDEITWMAMTDSLTELANRRQFHSGLDSMLQLASRQQNKVALVSIDLDFFKEVNDQHGHSVGDQLLVQVAALLRETFRASDLIARVGGDEFAVVMINPEDRSAIEAPLQRLIARLGQQLVLESHMVQIGVSLGVALYPEDANDSKQLLRDADQALYQAKHRGRNCYCFYSDLIEDNSRA